MTAAFLLESHISIILTNFSGKLKNFRDCNIDWCDKESKAFVKSRDVRKVETLLFLLLAINSSKLFVDSVIILFFRYAFWDGPKTEGKTLARRLLRILQYSLYSEFNKEIGCQLDMDERSDFLGINLTSADLAELEKSPCPSRTKLKLINNRGNIIGAIF